MIIYGFQEMYDKDMDTQKKLKPHVTILQTVLNLPRKISLG